MEIDKVDYMSELPDEIIRHILYSLPVADGFALKLLARRFRHIQVPFSNLHFNEETIFGTPENCLPNLRAQFVEKVYSFLKLFKGPYLNAFVVNFPLDHGFSSVIDDWIRFAISMEAESIELDFWSPGVHNVYKFRFDLLPDTNLFSRLKHLKLRDCSLDYITYSPATLNCLKTIELIRLPLDQISLDALLSSCVKLEWLTIKICSTPDTLRVCSANLRGLCIRSCQMIIELDAVQLHTFEYNSRNLPDLVFLSDVPLKRVHLGLFCARTDLFYTLLKKVLPELQILSLGWCSWENVPATIPEFASLKQLNFYQPQYAAFNYLSIINILNVCPMLQKLHVDLRSEAQ